MIADGFTNAPSQGETFQFGGTGTTYTIQSATATGNSGEYTIVINASVSQSDNTTLQFVTSKVFSGLTTHVGKTVFATAGSTAPFIGLFGTVWGIMNSFKSIAIAQNTNLAVVAPGIAEALFATALGLFVAIPAVVAYNKISNDLSKYFISLETFMGEFSTIFFRQLEKK